MTRLVVGLGNPGVEYRGTRHNVGFDVLDRLAAERGVLFRGPSSLEGWTGPRGFDWARAAVPGSDPDGDHGAFLLKPGTYMNRSGDIVAPVARWLAKRGELPLVPEDPAGAGDEELDAADSKADSKADAPPLLDPRAVLVVYDDMDLDVGRLRIRAHGGAGGHNGMRSIIHRLGTDRFPRVRIGVGRAGTDAARHVLSSFTEGERVEIDISVVEATEAILAWLAGEQLEKVMTRFHSRWNQDGPVAPDRPRRRLDSKENS